VLQQLNISSSSPSTASPSQQKQHTAAQMDAMCKRLHLHVMHKLSVHDMLNFDKLAYLPYNLIRTIRSFLNHHDLPILPSEHVMRKQTKQLVHHYEIGTFSIDDATIPFCRISDITSLLNITISSLLNNKQLVHYPNMPSNQIQIQTQTDKGADISTILLLVPLVLNANQYAIIIILIFLPHIIYVVLLSILLPPLIYLLLLI
jgi:hypothetical protein